MMEEAGGPPGASGWSLQPSCGSYSQQLDPKKLQLDPTAFSRSLDPLTRAWEPPDGPYTEKLNPKNHQMDPTPSN